MKAFISLLLVFALCFSFAACTAEEKPTETTQAETTVATTLPRPIIDFSEKSKEFKDENGRVVYTVKVQIPEITENAREAFSEYISNYFLEIFDEACKNAESNIENASNFMDRNGSDAPWSKKIDFDVRFSDGHYLSFVINEYFSMLGEEVEPALSSVTFDVINGTSCSLFDFAYEGYNPEEVERLIVEEFLCPDVSFYFFNGNELTEEQIQLVHDAFSTENYYLIDDGIGFYFSEYIINPQRSGTFTSHFKWNEVGLILKKPQ